MGVVKLTFPYKPKMIKHNCCNMHTEKNQIWIDLRLISHIFMFKNNYIFSNVTFEKNIKLSLRIMGAFLETGY